MNPKTTTAAGVRLRENGYLRVLLSDQTTGVMSFSLVKEVGVFDAQLVTRLPGVDEPMIGLVNFHNRIYWLADLESACQLTQGTRAPAAGSYSSLIILAKEQHRLAVAVNRVRGRVNWALTPLPNRGEDAHSLVTPCTADREPDQIVHYIDIDCVLERCLNVAQTHD